MIDARPMTEDGYTYLASHYPYVLMVPGHQDLYGCDDFNDAMALLRAEKMWSLPDSPVNR
jgi:hypothetical protein